MGLIVLDVFRRDEFSTDTAYKRWLVADIGLSDVMNCEILQSSYVAVFDYVQNESNSSTCGVTEFLSHAWSTNFPLHL